MCLTLASAVAAPPGAPASAPVDPNAIRDSLRQELKVLSESGSPHADRAGQLVASLRQLVEMTDGASPEHRPLEHFEDRMMLASAIGLVQAGPSADRVLYLMDGPTDARRLQVLAEQSLREFQSLRRDLDEAVGAARADWEKLAVGLPARLEELRGRADFSAAWVRLYLSAALAGQDEPATAARAFQPVPVDSTGPQAESLGRQERIDELLDAALTAARPHLQDSQPQARLSAALLCGMALSCQGRFEPVRAMLATAGGTGAPTRIALQASFELAKLHARQGRWDLAERQIAEFARAARRRLGDSASAEIELHQAFLRHYLLTRRALAEPASSAALSAQAQRVLVEVMRRNRDRLESIAPLVGCRYGDRADLGGLQTGIVLAVGTARLARDLPDRPGAAACFEQVLERVEPGDREFHAPALWHLASCLYAAGAEQAGGGWHARRRAAGYFRQLAERFADDPCALPAARNAVGILQARLAGLAGQEAPPDLRLELIAALEALLGRWGRRPDVQPYLLRLARQYELAGRLEDAVAAYARFQGSRPMGLDRLVAWNNALILRRRLLARAAGPAPDEPAEALAAELGQFVATARQAGLEANARGDAAGGQSLLALAGQADLRVAEMLQAELADPTRALAHLEQLERRWDDQTELLRQAGAMRVRTLLEQRQVPDAVAAMRRYRDRHGQAPEPLVWQVTLDLRRHLRDLSLSPGGPEPPRPLLEAYRELAELAHSAAPSDYTRRQVLAEAWTETPRGAEALAIFQDLARRQSDDARNLQGIARCHWLAGRHAEAIAVYRRLSEGLSPTEHGPLWWRVQLDMARCIHQAAEGRAEHLDRLGVRIRQLEVLDPALGGHRQAFEALRK